MIDPLLLSVTKVSTFRDKPPPTNASGFFFARDEKLLLITSRHVLRDDSRQHCPDSSITTENSFVLPSRCRDVS